MLNHHRALDGSPLVFVEMNTKLTVPRMLGTRVTVEDLVAKPVLTRNSPELDESLKARGIPLEAVVDFGFPMRGRTLHSIGGLHVVREARSASTWTEVCPCCVRLQMT